MRYGDIVVLGLITCVLSSCGPPQEGENTGAVGQEMSLGTLTPDNMVGAVGISVVNASTGEPSPKASGGLVVPDVVLTAAHVLDPDGTFFAFIEDDFVISDAAFGVDMFFHPTYGSAAIPTAYDGDPFQVDPENPEKKTAEICKTIGLDLAVRLLEEDIDAPKAAFPRQFHVDPPSGGIVGQTDAVTMYGYGLPNAGELRSAVGTVVNKQDIMLHDGKTKVGFGYHVDFSFIPGIGKPATEFGDSGGPVVVDGTDRNLAAHSCADITLPGGGTATGGFNHAIEPVDSWVNALVLARKGNGAVHLKDVNLKGRADHVIFFNDSSGLNVFIEFGEGCDPDFPLGFGECGGKIVDLGPISGLSFPSDLGSFDTTPFDDAVVLNDGVAFELRDLVGTPQVAALPGTFDYEEAAVLRLNADEFDDVQATGPSGTEFYFGTANGLTGPFAEGGGDSCRAAFSDSLANACGGQALGGDCWCDALCIANLDCCSDFTDTCLVGTDGEILVDAALSIAGELLAAAAETVDPVDNNAPAVSLTTPAAEGHGVFIDEDWILTTSEVVADQDLSALVATSFNGTPVPIGASLVNQTQQVALLRATAPTGVVPVGHKLSFYPGSPEELAREARFEVFGSIPSTSGLASTAFAGQRALVRPRTASLRPLDFRLGHSSTLGSDLLVRSGSPVVTQNGFLAGIASSAEANVLRMRDVAGAEQDVELITETVIPLLRTSHSPQDKSPSARYWIEQTLRRERLRDANGDGLHDLWASSNGTQLVSLSLSGGVAGAPVNAAPPFARTGNWRYVGRLDLGGVVTLWWREVDTGEIEIWQMDGVTRTGIATFFVDPAWAIASAGDIDGDGVDDLIWSNEDFGLHFFWLLRPIQAFGETIADLNASAGAALVAYGQWFSAFAGGGGGNIDLVGAEYFAPRTQLTELPETGKEQAAVDLLFRPRNSEALLLWEMEVFHRPCSEIADELITNECSSPADVILTYELGRNMAWLPPQPPHWSLVGMADYNLDGSTDLAWHASGSDAPSEELGRVQLWLSTAEGTFDTVLLETGGGSPLVLDPSVFTLNGR